MDGAVGDNRTAELAQAITHGGAISTTPSSAGAQSYHNQAVCSSIVCQAGESQVWDRMLLLTALKLSVTTSPPRPGKDRRIG